MKDNFIRKRFIRFKLNIYKQLEHKRIMADATVERKKFNYRKYYLRYSPSICGLYICSICGRLIKETEMQVDHIVPLASGGRNIWINTVATCSYCNNMKSDSLTLVFLAKGILCKSLEIIILSIKCLIRLILLSIYNVLRYLVILIIKPVRSKKVNWFGKLVYLRLLIELVI